MQQAALALLGGPPVLGPESHRRWPLVTDEDRRAVAGVLDRGILSGMHAPEAAALEREFAAFTGATHALLTHSGTSALALCVAALGLGEGDEIIVPAYSFVATPFAVMHQGAVPIFADVDPVHGLLDPAAFEAAIGPRTRAVMPVHVHGCPVDLDPIMAIARKHGLRVIEDAAQAHGATYHGEPVGALADMGGFSLQSSKNLPGGEGGLVVTRDDALAEAAGRVRSFGHDLGAADAAAYDLRRHLDGHRALDSFRLGWMYRGNEMMAAFVRSQLRRLAALTAQARAGVDALRASLDELPGVHLPRTPEGRTSVHHKVRVHLDPREADVDLSPRALRDLVLRALRAEGVEVVLWQNAPLPAQPVFQRLEGFGAGFPWTGDEATRRARENYDPARYPATTALLEGSVVLFSQTCPLIAQAPETVRACGEAFHKVWARRHELCAAARRGELGPTG